MDTIYVKIRSERVSLAEVEAAVARAKEAHAMLSGGAIVQAGGMKGVVMGSSISKELLKLHGYEGRDLVVMVDCANGEVMFRATEYFLSSFKLVK